MMYRFTVMSGRSRLGQADRYIGFGATHPYSMVRSLGCVSGYQVRLVWVTGNPVALYDLAKPVEISLVPDLLGLDLDDVVACIDYST